MQNARNFNQEREAAVFVTATSYGVSTICRKFNTMGRIIISDVEIVEVEAFESSSIDKV